MGHGFDVDDGGSNAIVICAAKAPGFFDVTNIIPETHEKDIYVF